MKILVQGWSLHPLMMMTRQIIVFINQNFRTHNKTLNERNKPLPWDSTKFGKEKTKYNIRNIPNGKNYPE